MSGVEKARRACRMIAADMEQDSAAMDGQPFDGAHVAPILGGLQAAVATLAKILDGILDGPTP